MTGPGDGADPPAPSANRLIARGGLWSLSAQVAPAVVMLVLTPAIIDTIGIRGFGVYALALGITLLLSAFDGGISTSAQRFFAVLQGGGDAAGATRLLKTLLLVVTAAALVVTTVMWVVAGPLATALNIPRALEDDAVLLFTLQGPLLGLLLVQQVFRALLAAHHRFRLISMAVTAGAAVYAVTALLALETGAGLRGLALALLLQQTVVALGFGLAAVRQTVRGRGLTTRQELRTFFGHAWRVQVAGVAYFVNTQADTLIIGAVLPVSNVGLYSAGASFASQLRNIPLNALLPVQSVLGTALGTSGQSAAVAEFVRLQRLWVRTLSGYVAVACASAWFGVTAWLGQDLSLAGVIATVLLVGYGVNLLTGVLSIFVAVLGAPELLARYGVASMLVNLALTVPLVFLGPVGVVVATATAHVAGSLYLLRLARTRLSVSVPSFLADVPWLPVLLTGAVTLGLQFVARPLIPSGPVGLLATGVPAFLGLLFFASTSSESRAAVRSLAHRVVDKLRAAARP